MTSIGESETRLLEAAADLLARTGMEGILRVRGTSMRPILEAGSVVAVDFTPRRPRLGDILLFRQADYLAVHRFLGHATRSDGRPCLRTRGDAHISLDPPLDSTSVHGRVVAVKTAGGWRDMDSMAARIYAAAVAAHDLTWAAAGVVAGRIDRRIGRAPSRVGLRSLVAALDRALLRAAHRLGFKLFHRPTNRPDEVSRSP